eukprot:TRINITY_DN3006_c0_g1_i1.p1 TRINITY_DN3006_c0_g1~~TRINITY_DN3006_c0_g1_i1.p1  ORF type:complete len:141 (-),score=10.48 TRINITY_DN3006_c0_g1_i1:112-534(-)
MVETELTIKNEQSFGTLHLMRTYLEEYLSYLIPRRMSLISKQREILKCNAGHSSFLGENGSPLLLATFLQNKLPNKGLVIEMVSDAHSSLTSIQPGPHQTTEYQNAPLDHAMVSSFLKQGGPVRARKKNEPKERNEKSDA